MLMSSKEDELEEYEKLYHDAGLADRYADKEWEDADPDCRDPTHQKAKEAHGTLGSLSKWTSITLIVIAVHTALGLVQVVRF